MVDTGQSITHHSGNAQIPFDAAVVILTTLRPTLLQAVRSVFAQDWPGRLQILIGVDAAKGRRAVLERICAECPERMAVTIMDLGYSTSAAHGGTGPNPYGGNLRTVLSYAANSDLICYVDDDNWLAPHHVSDLITAIDGFAWAYAYRWFVDGTDDSMLCVDDFQSVGPGKGVHRDDFGGFVDTNCMMINRKFCMGVFANWTTPMMADGTGDDRRVFDVLHRGYSVAWTGRPSVYYRLNPGIGISKARDQVFKMRNLELKAPQSRLENYNTRQHDLVTEYLNTAQPRKLNIGVGPNPLEGWLNTDLVTDRPGIFAMNAKNRFPFADAMFDYVASEHMVEHVSYRDGFKMLGECFRVLRPGGRIRIATPDLLKFLGLYGPDQTEIQKKYLDWVMRTFIPDVGGGHPTFVLNNLFRNWGHQFIYDEKVLRNFMGAAGFEDLERFQPGESDDPELRNIEAHGRVLGDPEINDFETMVIEGRKPE